SAGFVTIQECVGSCTGRYISVVPRDGDGVIPTSDNPIAGEQVLPMPVVGSGDRISPHRIAHQWGHVVGLAHTYDPAGGGGSVRFDRAFWGQRGGSGFPPRGGAARANPPPPAVTSGTFGVFDGKSKMNGFHSDGICGAEEPDEDSVEP